MTGDERQSELAASHAEIERLYARLKKTEAERDAARAQLADYKALNEQDWMALYEAIGLPREMSDAEVIVDRIMELRNAEGERDAAYAKGAEDAKEAAAKALELRRGFTWHSGGGMLSMIAIEWAIKTIRALPLQLPLRRLDALVGVPAAHAHDRVHMPASSSGKSERPDEPH